MNEINLIEIKTLQIDPEGKTLLVVTYHDDIHSDQLERVQDSLSIMVEKLNHWILSDNQPIYTLSVSDNVGIRLEKVKSREGRGNELLKKLVKEIGENCWIIANMHHEITDDYVVKFCFFCNKDHPNHSDDCIYASILELVNNE